jgi:hypothetical protein
VARRQATNEPPVRRSFLIFGGVAVGAAVIAFVLMNFVLGGDDGGVEEDTTPTTTVAPGAPAGQPAPAAPTATPKPSEPPGLRPGGDDPFAAGSSAQETAVQPASVEPEKVKIKVVTTYGTAADIKFGSFALEGVQQDQILSPRFNVDEIKGDCVYFKDDGERFKVCAGDSVKR